MNPKNLKGNVKGGSWEILLLPMLSLSLVETSNLHGGKEK
jgi:hypothetical protein